MHVYNIYDDELKEKTNKDKKYLKCQRGKRKGYSYKSTYDGQSCK